MLSKSSRGLRWSAAFLLLSAGAFFASGIAPGFGCAPERAADPGRVDPPPLAAAFGFSKGLRPIPFDPEREAVRAGEERATTSADCRACHETAYRNWHASRHRVAFTNPLYRESHAREPSRWCVNCHAPFVAPGAAAESPLGPGELTGPESAPLQAADGISCMVCHVRAGQVLTGARPVVSGRPAHEYRIEPLMKSAEFCGSCHQFNFLTARTSRPGAEVLEYSDQPMQDTLREWRNSAYNQAGGQNCQSCHLFAGTEASHRFPGGHALADLARAIDIEARRAEEGRIALRLYALGIGHAFPTGDLFRALRVKVYTAGGRPVKELILKKRFAALPVAGPETEVSAGPAGSATGGSVADPLAPSKILVADDTIPPPAPGDFVSSRTYVLAWPGGDELRYEMYMDYLEPTNHLVTRLPLSMTSPLFKSGRLRIQPGAFNRD